MTRHKTTGTYEWADWTLNLQRGCRYGCLYCYGREAALRRGQIPSAAAWREPILYKQALATRYRLRSGVGMLPSTHDVTPWNAPAVIHVARRLLGVGNRLLLVSKPDPLLWGIVRDALAPWREQMTLRFTIGALDPALVRAWEPHAPGVEARLKALRESAADGWQTSVSCEPLLDPPRAADLVEAVAPHVAGTIWIGTCRQLRKRVAWTIARPGVADLVEALEAEQTPEAMRRVDACLAALPPDVRAKVRYKDSYAKILGRQGVDA